MAPSGLRETEETPAPARGDDRQGRLHEVDSQTRPVRSWMDPSGRGRGDYRTGNASVVHRVVELRRQRRLRRDTDEELCPCAVTFAGHEHRRDGAADVSAGPGVGF